MDFPQIISRVPFAACRARKSAPTAWLQVLFLALPWSLAPGLASADVIIMDLTDAPITAFVSDSLNPGDNTPADKPLTADKDTPEKLSFSISVDGTGEGSGVAVLLEPDGTVSDLLEVTVLQRLRGMNIPFLQISGTFTSDADPGGLLAGLGLTDEIMKKVIDNGLREDGTQQDIGARLINTVTGDPLNISTLKITAASDVDVVPEPSSVLLLVPGLLALAVLHKRPSRI
jgi:hypothetical protein